MTDIITTKNELKEALIEIMAVVIDKTTAKPNPEKLYTISQTAEKIGKSRMTVSRMVKAGRIEATTDGKYISQRAIDKYLNA